MDERREQRGVEAVARPSCRVRLRRWLIGIVAFPTLIALGVYLYLLATAREPVGPTQIFQGVMYECLELPPDNEGSGLAHIVEVDLTAPGVSLYLTPLDSIAFAAGHQYRLEYGPTIAQREHLAVLVNGALFGAPSRWWNSAGEWGDGLDTIVADHQVSHVHPESYLLWLEDDLTPHLSHEKPPAADILQQARWGIGGQGIAIAEGEVSQFLDRGVDRRAILGIDTARRRLWIAVFTAASPHRAATILAQHGAREAIMLDGGDSTTMVIGEHAATIPPGTLIGGYRPIATALGIRARPIE